MLPEIGKSEVFGSLVPTFTPEMSVYTMVEIIVKQLNLPNLPLVNEFIASAFLAMRDGYATEIDNLYNKNDKLAEEVKDFQEAYESVKRHQEQTFKDFNNLRDRHQDMKNKYFELKRKYEPFVLDWVALCEKHEGNKIDIIKEIREQTNLNLKEAKELVEANTDSSFITDSNGFGHTYVTAKFTKIFSE